MNASLESEPIPLNSHFAVDSEIARSCGVSISSPEVIVTLKSTDTFGLFSLEQAASNALKRITSPNKKAERWTEAYGGPISEIDFAHARSVIEGGEHDGRYVERTLALLIRPDDPIIGHCMIESIESNGQVVQFSLAAFDRDNITPQGTIAYKPPLWFDFFNCFNDRPTILQSSDFKQEDVAVLRQIVHDLQHIPSPSMIKGRRGAWMSGN